MGGMSEMGRRKGVQPAQSAAANPSSVMLKLIRRIDDSISLVRADGTTVMSTGQYSPILGYPTTYWPDRSLLDLLHPDDVLRVAALRDQLLAHPETPVEGSFRLLAADGLYQLVHAFAENLIDDPEVGAIVITAHNITAERAMVSELAAAREQALAETDQRSRLLAAMGHELRTPLRSAATLVERLDDESVPAHLRAMVHQLRLELHGLNGVLDQMLDSSRLAMGALALALRPTVIRELVDEVLTATRRPGVPSLDVRGEVEADVPAAVVTDPLRLRQVLLHLTGNSLAFTERGTITLRVSVAAGRIAFAIRDTGRGIPPDELGSIFEPFSVGSNAGPAAGGGLGLAIVRHIVELMEGTVDVASTLGSGTTFTVALPLRPAPSSSPGTGGAGGRGAGLRVLVVDGVEQRVLAAEQLGQLHRLGLTGVPVGSGEAAVEVMSSGTGPELVLLDLELPGIDGLETTRRIRADEVIHGRRAIIVGVAGRGRVADRVTGEAAGMDDLLIKPVSLAVLGQTLERWLYGGQQSIVRPAPVDELVLDELSTDIGSRAVVVGMVRTYLNELHGRRVALAAAADEGNVAAARSVAHTLKSSSLLLGATDVGLACEQLSGVDDPAVLQHLVSEVMQTSTAAARWFQNWLSREPAPR